MYVTTDEDVKLVWVQQQEEELAEQIEEEKVIVRIVMQTYERMN